MAAADRPVELVWSHRNTEAVERELESRVFTSLNELKIAVLEQAKRLEDDPKSVQEFFKTKDVGFITN